MINSGLSGSAVIIRFVLGGAAVAASYLVSRRLGGKWGGIFAAFPAVYLASIITVAAGLPPAQGISLSLQVSKGALVGMLANIVCAVAAGFFIRRRGWHVGLVYALLVWLACVTAVYMFVYKSGLGGL